MLSTEEVRELVVAGVITQERACTRKTWYPDLSQAERARKRLERRYDSRLEPYYCPFCSRIHLTTVRS